MIVNPSDRRLLEQAVAMRRRCLELLSDEPQWVEANALLHDEATVYSAAGSGCLMIHPSRAIGICVAVSPEQLAEILNLHRNIAILCNDNVTQMHNIAVDCGRDCRLVEFMVLVDEPAAVDGVSLLTSDESLAHIDSPILRADLLRALAAGQVWTVRVDNLPVSFAYAAWRSDRHVALAVDTVQRYRQRGLATIAVSAAIEAELRCGRQPVWSAIVDNVASMQLAHRIGFTKYSTACVVLPASNHSAIEDL